jgi:cytochrome P450
MTTTRAARRVDDLAWHPSRNPLSAMPAFLRDPLGFAVEGHRRHGPVFRTHFPLAKTVVLAGLDANRFVWRNDDLWTYREAFSAFAEQFGERYLTSLDGVEHRAKRKRLAPGFRQQNLAETGPAMTEELERALASLNGEPRELRSLCQQLVIAMTARSVLGRPLDQRTIELVARVEHGLLAGAALGSARHAYFRLSGYRRAKAELRSRLASLLDDGFDGEGRGSTVLAATDGPDVGLDERIWDLFLLLSAGAETSSALICWTLLYLDANPQWRDRLRSSLDAWSPTDAGVPHSHPELFATVLEAERLRPPLPVALRVSVRDFDYEGTTIPAGTRVLHANTVTHFLPDVFDEPHRFDPARFLGDHGTPREALATFGGGSHVCIGLPLARMQAVLAIGLLVRGWDVELDAPVSFRARLSGAVVPVEKRIQVTLRPTGRAPTAPTW